MSSPHKRITFDLSGVESMLNMYPEKAHQALWVAVRAATKPLVDMAKQRVRQSGQAEYHEQTKGRRPPSRRDKPLKQTIGAVTRDYVRTGGGKIVAYVGPQYPAGAHGHLVEFGHRKATGGTLRRIRSVARSSSGGGIRKGSFPASTARAQLLRKHRSGQGRVLGMTRAFPFMLPSFSDASAQAQAVLVERVKAELAK